MHPIRIGTVIIIKSNRETVEPETSLVFIFYATSIPLSFTINYRFDIFRSRLSFLDETISSRLRNNRRYKLCVLAGISGLKSIIDTESSIAYLDV